MARKPAKRKSAPPPAPLSRILEQLALPALLAEEDPECVGMSIEMPDALTRAGDEIEALRFLGKPQPEEPAHYDWLRELAFHHAGDRKQAKAAFRRHFDRWPCDISGTATVANLDAER